MEVASIDVTTRVNGMGEQCGEGSYIRAVVQTKTGWNEYKISLGQAEILRDGLNVLLPEPGQPLYTQPVIIHDAALTHPLETVGGEDLFPGASIQDELHQYRDFDDVPSLMEVVRNHFKGQ